MGALDKLWIGQAKGAEGAQGAGRAENFTVCDSTGKILGTAHSKFQRATGKDVAGGFVQVEV